MNQKLGEPPQKEPRGIDDSDDFDLPMAPPSKPSRKQPSVTTADEMSKGRDQPGNDSNPDFYPVVEKHPRPKIEMAKGVKTSCGLDPNKSNLSHKNSGTESSLQDIPVTIDDHPLVAVVVVLLSIFSTIVIGWMSIDLPVFLIGLFVIYAITYDFFRKRRIRNNIRIIYRQSDN